MSKRISISGNLQRYCSVWNWSELTWACAGSFWAQRWDQWVKANTRLKWSDGIYILIATPVNVHHVGRAVKYARYCGVRNILVLCSSSVQRLFFLSLSSMPLSRWSIHSVFWYESNTDQFQKEACSWVELKGPKEISSDARHSNC